MSRPPSHASAQNLCIITSPSSLINSLTHSRKFKEKEDCVVMAISICNAARSFSAGSGALMTRTRSVVAHIEGQRRGFAGYVPPEKKSVEFPKLVDKLPSMDGKVVVITGCTSGTGQIAAHAIAKKGGEIVMLNRPSERAEKALKLLQEQVPGVKASFIACDNGDLAGVKQAAKEVIAKHPDGIDVLCNNAGVMATVDTATKDGFDVQMQTNHLSHYLLTKELYPLLNKRADA
eukprot:3903034-Rhodomonas_salina.1